MIISARLFNRNAGKRREDSAGHYQGQETLPYSQKLEPNQYVLIGKPFTEDLMGIPFTKTDTQLRDAVKAAIERLQAKGVYDQILAKYGLQANKYSPITINQGK